MPSCRGNLLIDFINVVAWFIFVRDYNPEKYEILSVSFTIVLIFSLTD